MTRQEAIEIIENGHCDWSVINQALALAVDALKESIEHDRAAAKAK